MDKEIDRIVDNIITTIRLDDLKAIDPTTYGNLVNTVKAALLAWKDKEVVKGRIDEVKLSQKSLKKMIANRSFNVEGLGKRQTARLRLRLYKLLRTQEKE